MQALIFPTFFETLVCLTNRQVVAVVAAHSGSVLAFQPQCNWLGQRPQVIPLILMGSCVGVDQTKNHFL